jgi:hypothetical protein
MIDLETPMGSPFRGHDFFLGYIYILCAIKYIYIHKYNWFEISCFVFGWSELLSLDCQGCVRNPDMSGW